MRDEFRRCGQSGFGGGGSCEASRGCVQRPIDRCQGRCRVPDSVWPGVVRCLACEVLLGEARSHRLDLHKPHPDDSSDGRASLQRAEYRRSVEEVGSHHACLLPSMYHSAECHWRPSGYDVCFRVCGDPWDLGLFSRLRPRLLPTNYRPSLETSRSDQPLAGD